MTTQNASLAGRWKPSTLMVRILSAFVLLAIVIGLVLQERTGHTFSF